jgi:hypothetical protein
MNAEERWALCRKPDRNGLFLLAQSGKAIKIRNNAKCQPTTW